MNSYGIMVVVVVFICFLKTEKHALQVQDSQECIEYIHGIIHGTKNLAPWNQLEG